MGNDEKNMVAFRLSRRGYDRQDVNRYIEEMSIRFTATENALRNRIKELEERLSSESNEKPQDAEKLTEENRALREENKRLSEENKRLSDAGLIDTDKFDKALNPDDYDYKFLKNLPERKNMLEGYLFPSTYYITKGMSEHDIINMMLAEFDAQFKDEYYDRAKQIGYTTDEIVTMASIIEKETDIFFILREYFSGEILAPFSNYIREKDSTIDMTQFMNKNYKEMADKIKSILWE